MKKLILIIAILLGHTIYAQKYFTRTGTTEFKASVAAFEPVEAVNKSTSVVLKADSGEIAALLLMKAFRFKVALMQEHFNENYMDSDQFPKATFKGKIIDFDHTVTSGKKTYTIEGALTVRGVTKKIKTTAQIEHHGATMRLTSTFSVTPQDFDIKIPSIVRKKIAEKINVYLDYELKKR